MPAKFVVNHVRGKMHLPLDVDLQDMDWDELPTSQSEPQAEPSAFGPNSASSAASRLHPPNVLASRPNRVHTLPVTWARHFPVYAIVVAGGRLHHGTRNR